MTEPTASDDDKTVVSNEPTVASPDPRFRMVRCLGSGGMGDVHLAEDSALRRKVAIKTIRADLCKDAEICKRIERECLLHARIGSHPHIVTLFDRIEHGGQINLVMEYVEGETLQSLLTRGASSGRRLSWKNGIDIAVQTLEALERIHAHGIVHRDIKPANIIVTRDDAGAYCAKLMDFGIARMQADDEQSTMLTKDGAGGPGTPTYMAPEQIDPKTFGPVSSATDVYAMGVMLYQILSGQPPFVGSLTEVFNGHLNRRPPEIDFHGDATVPPELKEILECALAKKPGQRFPSARAFREELLRLARGGLAGRAAGTGGEDTNRTLAASEAAAAVPPHGATVLDTTGAGKGRRRVGAAIIAALIGAAVLAGGGYLLFGRGGSEAASPAKEAAPTQAERTAEPAPPEARPAEDAGVPDAGAVAAPPAADAIPAGVSPAAVSPAAAVPDQPVAPQTAPGASAAAPADDSGPQTAAMEELMKRLEEKQSEPAPAAKPPEPQPAAAKPPASEPPAAQTEPDKPEPKSAEPAPASPGAKKEPPKPAQPDETTKVTGQPQDKGAEPAKAEPDKPAGSGWKVIDIKDRKVD